MNDIPAAAAFLEEKGFKRIRYWVEWHGIFAVDGNTGSSFFFPADMSLKDAEKEITENRKRYGLSATTQ